MEKKLTIGSIIKDGLSIGLTNAVPIFVNLLLFILTVWIPYLNIGTIIGLCVGIPAKLSKGEELSMTEIFNPEYRKTMSEFFLSSGLITVGMMATFILIIPAFVLSIAWMFVLLLVVDKKKAPIEAFGLSFKVTNGNKGVIFLALLVLMVIGFLIGMILALIPVIGWVFCIVAMLVMIFVSIGVEAYCYKELCADL